jgi:Tol biopolymer transport system component
MRLAWALAILVLGGCDRVFNLEHVEDGGAGSGSADGPENLDAMDDAGIPAMFSPSTQIYELSSVSTEDDPTVTEDGLEIYFNSYRTGGAGSGDIYHSSRKTTSSKWDAPTNVTALNTSALDNTPRIRGDGVLMYMSREPSTTREIYVTTRPNRTTQTWTALALVPALNSTADDSEAMLTADGLAIYFSSTRAGTKDLYVATRATDTAMWDPPVPVPGVNTTFDEDSPNTHDGLTLYFSSDRPGSAGMTNIWRATRPSTSVAFGVPEPVAELNTDEREEDPWVSPDGRTIWFASAIDGGVFHLFTATR